MNQISKWLREDRGDPLQKLEVAANRIDHLEALLSAEKKKNLSLVKTLDREVRRKSVWAEIRGMIIERKQRVVMRIQDLFFWKTPSTIFSQMMKNSMKNSGNSL
jgi:hypothetical protein